MTNDIQEIRSEVTEFISTIPAITVTNLEEYNKAGDLVKQLSNRAKRLEDKRLEYTRPLDESKKRIMDDFKLMIAPLEEMVAKLKSGMTTWYVAEQRRIDKERREAERAAQKEREEAEAKRQEELKKQREANPTEIVFPTPIAQQPVVVAPSVDLKTQRGDFATTTMKKRWTYEVVDESKVPRKYLTVDRGAVQAAVRSGIRNIEGIKIYEEIEPSVR